MGLFKKTISIDGQEIEMVSADGETWFSPLLHMPKPGPLPTAVLMDDPTLQMRRPYRNRELLLRRGRRIIQAREGVPLRVKYRHELHR